MKFFQQLTREGYPKLGLYAVCTCELAREKFGTVFNSAFNTDRAKLFPKAIQKKEAAAALLKKKADKNLRSKGHHHPWRTRGLL